MKSKEEAYLAHLMATAPAYPIVQNEDQETVRAAGLSKREVFAMAAMQGLISSPHHVGEAPTYIADQAVNQADELIKRLAQ